MQMGVDASDPQHVLHICSDVTTTQWRSQVDLNPWTVTGGKSKNMEPGLPAGYLGCLPTNTTSTGTISGLSPTQSQALSATIVKQVAKSPSTFTTLPVPEEELVQAGTITTAESLVIMPAIVLLPAQPTLATTIPPGRTLWNPEMIIRKQLLNLCMVAPTSKYCSVCKFFIFHHKPGHTACWLTCCNATAATGTNTTTTGAASAGVTPAAMAAAAALGNLKASLAGTTDFFG
jgi:hypothetical protein